MVVRQKPKSIESEETARLSPRQVRVAGPGTIPVVEPESENRPLMERIAELEEENARLRSTVRFLQEMEIED